jgi:glycolate oxidase FAD binding subunit
LRIVGGETKDFYGLCTEGEPLSTAAFSGVLRYEPTELVVTLRAGTPLRDLDALLRDHGQMLGCEPPRFGDRATVGGMVACGLAGPRRPYAGGVRDCVLGLRCLAGSGEILSFGGQVMKNVAGFDIARMMVGALGTLGLILEVSLKVAPRPRQEVTIRRELGLGAALELMCRWGREPLPLSATAYDGTALYTRLSGSEAAIAAARAHIGGEALGSAASFWEAVREQALPFFADDRPLWRISVPPAALPIETAGECFIDWGGAQRWLKTDCPGEQVRRAASSVGGYAVLFRGERGVEQVFPPLAPPLWKLHKRLKHAFDPKRIFNPDRMYRGL